MGAAGKEFSPLGGLLKAAHVIVPVLELGARVGFDRHPLTPVKSEGIDEKAFDEKWAGELGNGLKCRVSAGAESAQDNTLNTVGPLEVIEGKLDIAERRRGIGIVFLHGVPRHAVT